MWSITNNNLPATANSLENYGSAISVLKPTTTLTGSGAIARLFNKLITTVTTAVATDDPGAYAIAVDSSPQLIASTDTVFYPAINPATPQPGEFVYVDNTAIVYSNKPLTTVTYSGSANRIQNLVATANGLNGLNVVGEVSISDSWQDHPSASMTLICRQQDLGLLRNRFSPGTFVDLCGFSFIVNNYSEVIHKNDAAATVSVSLRGKWEMYVNKAIALNPPLSGINGSFQDPECQVGYVPLIQRKYISLNTLASRVGARISGINFDIEVPSVQDNTTTTINNELANYTDIKGGFIEYSNPATILFKSLDNCATFNYTENDLLSEFNTTINRLSETPKSNSYYAANLVDFNALVPDTITPKSNYIQGENVSNIPKPAIQNYTTPDIFNSSGKITEPTAEIEPKYELRKVVRSKRTTGDPDPTHAPTSINKITTLDMNFDRSGVTKTTIDIEEEDNMPVRETTRRYGFAYTAWNITKFQSVPGQDASAPVLKETNPATWWVLIEETYKEYQYDKNTGYLLGYDLTGRKLIRPNIEGDDLYTMEYQIANNAGQDITAYQTALYNTYQFEYAPVHGAKRYLLVPHKAYYERFDSEEQYIKKCRKNGLSYYEANPNYIQSLFAIAETEEYSCYVVRNNPANLLRTLPEEPYSPPLLAGGETFNRQFLTILDSQNTSPGYVKAIDAPNEDRYQTYASNFSAQDANFASVTEQTSTSESTGIPPVHTRKPPKYELVKKDANQKLNKDYRYVFWTSPYNGGYPRTGSYSFDKARKIEDVITAVNNQQRVDDVRNTLSSSCTVPLNLAIRSGDKVNLSIRGAYFQRRATSISHSLTIQGVDVNGRPYITSNGTQLTLGIERPASVNHKREPSATDNKPKNNKPLFTLDYIYSMGNLLNSDLPRRGRA